MKNKGEIKSTKVIYSFVVESQVVDYIFRNNGPNLLTACVSTNPLLPLKTLLSKCSKVEKKATVT